MKEYILPLLFCISFVGQMKGQLFSWDNRMLYFSAGLHKIDNAPLNESLASFGFNKLNDFNPSISMGITGFRNQWILGLYLESQFSGDAENMDYRINVSTADFTLQLGYLLKQTERWRLYPTIGLGIGSAFMRIEEKNVVINNFDDVLNNRSSTLNNFHAPIPIALNADFLFGPRSVKYLVGISFGYDFTIVSRFWGLEQPISGLNSNATLRDIDPFNPGGFFFKLRLGLNNDYTILRN